MIRKSLSLWCLIIIFSSNVVLPMEPGSSQQSSNSPEATLSSDARRDRALRKIEIIIAYKDLQEDITAFYWLPQDLRGHSMETATYQFNQELARLEFGPSFQGLSAEDQQNKLIELAERNAIRLLLSRNSTYETNDMSSDGRFNLATRRIGLLIEYTMLQDHLDVEDSRAEEIAKYELWAEIARNSREHDALELAENKLSTQYLSKIRAGVYTQSDENPADENPAHLKDFLQGEARRYVRDLSPLDEGFRDFVIRHASSEVNELINEINNKERKKCLGVILYGPASSGKTTLAQAIASKVGISHCKLIKVTQLESIHNRSAEINIDALLRHACAGSGKRVVIVDEFDSIISPHVRQDDIDAGGIKAFSQALDAYQDNPDLIFIGTTNHINRLPEECLDRINFEIRISHPNAQLRKDIIGYYLGKKGDSINQECLDSKFLIKLVKDTRGFSIRNIIGMLDKAERVAEQRRVSADARGSQAAATPSVESFFQHFFGVAQGAVNHHNDNRICQSDLTEGLHWVNERPEVRRRLEELDREETGRNNSRALASGYVKAGLGIAGTAAIVALANEGLKRLCVNIVNAPKKEPDSSEPTTSDSSKTNTTKTKLNRVLRKVGPYLPYYDQALQEKNLRKQTNLQRKLQQETKELQEAMQAKQETLMKELQESSIKHSWAQATATAVGTNLLGWLLTKGPL